MTADSASPIHRKTTISAVSLAVVATLAGLGLASQASAIDRSVRMASFDQPRVNVAFALPGAPDTPLQTQTLIINEQGELEVIDTIRIEAFYDTGASGIVFSPNVQAGLGFALQEINGEPVVFSDIAADGEVPFNVSEPLLIGMTDHWGAFDAGFDPARTRQLASAANWNSLYTDRVGGPLGGGGSPVRTQIGPIGGNPLLELNVVGMPAMQGRVVVMDARPTNNAVQQILDPDNADPDANLRTFNYAPGAGYSPGLNNIDPFDPGIVPTDLHVSLSYADFGQFTSITPGGIKPALAENPFIGPNPLLNDPNDTTPPVTLSANGQSVDGSWLLDTGAAASFVSQESASQIGVSYDPNNPLGSDSPRLLGVDSDDQFTLQITGIAGNPTVVSGFYADNLLLRTDEGNPTDDLDPNHINYRGAPVLVLDIAVFDEVAQEEIILDGIFGMNYLIASTDLLQSPGDIFPIFFNPAETPFDYVVFDEPGGKLGLTLDGDNLPTPGDANRDGDVNLADFLILRDNFGDDDANFYDADFNGDNVVDLADFLILRDNFGSSDTGDMNAWLATVPEPASMGLVFALGGLALRRRR